MRSLKIQGILLIGLLMMSFQGICGVMSNEFAIATAIQSNMVIQQNKPLKIWGTANPGETIKIKADWQNKISSTTVNQNGEWICSINVPKAKKGDFSTHRITIIHQSDTLRLKNILIGEVWVCAGQSNMEMTMKPALPWHKGVLNYETEIPKANYPNIRLFKLEKDTGAVPSIFCHARWTVCSPETIGQFSGVAYYFGRSLYEKLNVPIGLVLAAYGGASCQAFTSRQVLERDTVLQNKYLDPYLKHPEKVKSSDRPSLIYNKMIYPLINLSIKGFIWYQGESNAHDKQLYTRLCSAMIKGWRKDFKQGKLPFYFVQVPGYNWGKSDSLHSDYAIFREAQQALLNLDHTAMAVTLDVGESDAIHPRKKKPVGIRLAKIALHKSYGYAIHDEGLQMKSFKIKGEYVKIKYKKSSMDGGLTTSDGHSPKYFYVSGKDKVFAQATAQIKGNQIILHSSEVKNPVAVRYAFFDAPITNFQNKENLPAWPFRTDNWEEVSYK